MNNKEATIAGLLACGYKEVHRSNKYRCFEEVRPAGVPFRTYLVGKAGALRVIRAQDSQISQSVTKTGSKIHLGLQYVGRLGVNLEAAKCLQILMEQIEL